jgi:hypothetical protein
VVQRLAGPFRQLADFYMQCGLGNVQLSGGASEIHGLAEDEEGLQPIGAHRAVLRMSYNS